MTLGGRFIGIAVTSSNGAADELPAAVPDVENFQAALAGHYDGLIHKDPDDEPAVQALLTQLRGTHLTGPLIVYWSGHGAAFGDDLRLLATNSGTSAADGTPAA
ncbi:MAG: hypothetical protein QG597_5170, partial [Actinomycetota bacterium]|nr:hypothetical protein [Actinomycetota bacterium]